MKHGRSQERMKWFLVGGGLYPLLELLWRGRTHYSMALAGGVGGMVLHRLARSRVRLLPAALLGGGCITLIEGCSGLIWNRRYRVWDYRKQPMNWRGQVCAPFSLLWCGLAGAFIGVDRASMRSRGRRGG